jgi:hypothetical protein
MASEKRQFLKDDEASDPLELLQHLVERPRSVPGSGDEEA